MKHRSTMLVFLIFTIIFTKVQCAVLPLNKHIDLQKVGEVNFGNEKYNVLKTVIHSVRDHFKDFMLRTNIDFPTQKLYIDKNGMRHYWTGLENFANYEDVSKVQTDAKALQIYEIENDKADVFKQVGLSELLANKNALVANTETVTNKNTILVTTPTTLGVYRSTKKNNATDKFFRNQEYEDYSDELPTTTTTRKPGKYIQATFYCPFLGLMTYLVPEEMSTKAPEQKPKH